LIKRQGERTWESVVAERGLDYARELVQRHARPNGACKAVMEVDELARLDVQWLSEEHDGREEEPPLGEPDRGDLPPGGGEVIREGWQVSAGAQPGQRAQAAGAVAQSGHQAREESAAPQESVFQPVRLGVRGGVEVPVRPATDLRQGCAVLTPTMEDVHRAIGANHGNRKELRKAVDTSTTCTKLLALEESMPLGVVVLAEGAKAQCDHQLQAKTADTVASEATQKVSGTLGDGWVHQGRDDQAGWLVQG
jgi:hypothetical protein